MRRADLGPWRPGVVIDQNGVVVGDEARTREVALQHGLAIWVFKIKKELLEPASGRARRGDWRRGESLTKKLGKGPGWRRVGR